MSYEDFDWTHVSNERNALTQRYEPIQPILFVSMSQLLNNAVLFDVGANVGAYSILAGSRPEFSEVFAFEPNPHCFFELEKNIRLNKLESKVHCWDCALSDRVGKAVFGFTSRYAGDGGLSETHLFSHLIQDEKTVRLQTLDSVFDGKDRMLAMKIDVEGHELEVLKGAERTLSENQGILQVEIHDLSPHRDETRATISKLGWTPVIRVGSDNYFSKHPSVQNDQDRIELIERCLAAVVHNSLHGPHPARRRIANGVTLEISSKHAQRIKRLLRVLRLRA